MLWSGVVVEVDTHTPNTLNGIRVGNVPANSSLAQSNATAMVERPTIVYTGYSRPGYEAPLANGIPLRILALGASTTRGDSPVEVDNNGFRRPLRQKLTALGHQVNFVGTERLGNMTDNDITAGPGVQVDTIHEMATHIVSQSKPNLILVNAGTNDCLMHVDIDNFYKRYDNLVQYLLMASHKATIVLGTLLPTWDTRFNGREDVFRVNPQIRRLAKIYQKQGLPIVLAEMQGPDGIQDQNLAEDGRYLRILYYLL
jgi:lysophospholipase L1-like esterase